MQRAIPIWLLCLGAIDRWATAVAKQPVGGELSNMLNVSQPSPSDQLSSRLINRPYPQGPWRYNQCYNRPSTVNYSTDLSQIT